MTFEDSVEKNLWRSLAQARALAGGGAVGAGKSAFTSASASASTAPLLFEGTAFLVALSGGVDSTALLLALVSLRDAFNRAKNAPSQAGHTSLGGLGLELTACHVNHGLRGVESAADELFCRELCARLDVPLLVQKLSLPAVETGGSEALWRKARYESLTVAARQRQAPYVVTAHNLDDQAETLLFRLFRGTALRGVVGMEMVRPLTDQEWPVLLRPLLGSSRAEIEDYLLAKGQSSRLDHTNDNEAFSRNFLRKRILKPIKERFPTALENIERFRLTMASENDYMSALAEALYERAFLPPNGLRLEVLTGEHVALTNRVIAKFIEQAGVLPSFQRVGRVQSLISEAQQNTDRNFSKQLSLGENLELIASKDRVLLKPEYELVVSAEEFEWRRQAMPAITVKLPRPGRSSAMTMIPWLNFALHVEDLKACHEDEANVAADTHSVHNTGLESWPLYERCALSIEANLPENFPENAPLCLRPRSPGDRLQPFGMSENVRLKKYLHSNKALFLQARPLWPFGGEALALRLFPVLASGSEVLWVPGLGLSARLKNGLSPSHRLTLVPLADRQNCSDKQAGFDPGTC
ncbi:MAG: tRNA lysidine(34) synthetase TilS [Cyanobacteria bacterium REEB67]|nr:tRNA lysidine(34) synthetase TilS [Cyanobacteria bacterium REEB67]